MIRSQQGFVEEVWHLRTSLLSSVSSIFCTYGANVAVASRKLGCEGSTSATLACCSAFSHDASALAAFFAAAIIVLS